MIVNIEEQQVEYEADRLHTEAERSEINNAVQLIIAGGCKKEVENEDDSKYSGDKCR